MNCPKCGYTQPDNGETCAKCGIYFHKYERVQQRRLQQKKHVEVGLMWQMNEAENPVFRVGRILFLFALAWLSWGLIFSPIDFWQGNAASRSFLHSVNIPFHEFGHISLRIFGQLMASLGGSLAQLLMPLICLVVFLWKTRDAYAAAVALWWLGESFLDLVSYINDAMHLTMPLMGGNEGRSSPYGFHDWEYILTETGLIHQAHGIATMVHILGAVLMVSAMVWMLLLLVSKR